MHTQQASSESESDTDYQDISQAKRTRSEPKSRRTRQRPRKDDPNPKHAAPVHAVDAEQQSAPNNAVNAKQQSELYDVGTPPHQQSSAPERRSLIDAENSGSISAGKDGPEDTLHEDDMARQSSAALANVTESMDESGSHYESQSVHNLSDTPLSQHSPNSAAENQVSSDDHDEDFENSLARRPSSLEHGNDDSAEILNNSLSKRMSDAVVPASVDYESNTDAQLSADTQHGSYTGKRAGRPAKGKLPVSGRDSDADHRAESHSDDSDQELEHMPELRVVTPSMPSIEDYLPMPFPHKRSNRNAPPAPDPNRTTVVDWIGEQQNFLLDTMRERVDERLTLIRERNAEERQRLEKKLRSQ